MKKFGKDFDGKRKGVTSATTGIFLEMRGQHSVSRIEALQSRTAKKHEETPRYRGASTDLVLQ